MDEYMTTDTRAVDRLTKHLPAKFTFAEPCAGNGDLIKMIEKKFPHSVCNAANDIMWADGVDALELGHDWFSTSDFIITNPPWTRDILHDMISHFGSIKPTWLLFDADWAHTKQAGPFLPHCKKIVSVGRLKWITGSKSDGKDNAAWYLFEYDPDWLSRSFEYTSFFGAPNEV
jgi:hypothetical protein